MIKQVCIHVYYCNIVLYRFHCAFSHTDCHWPEMPRRIFRSIGNICGKHGFINGVRSSICTVEFSTIPDETHTHRSPMLMKTDTMCSLPTNSVHYLQLQPFNWFDGLLPAGLWVVFANQINQIGLNTIRTRPIPAGCKSPLSCLSSTGHALVDDCSSGS